LTTKDSEHIRASVEAKVKMEMVSKKHTKYREGYTDALMWVLDLFDFSSLDVDAQ
jgi:hypothetical protein